MKPLQDPKHKDSLRTALVLIIVVVVVGIKPRDVLRNNPLDTCAIFPSKARAIDRLMSLYAIPSIPGTGW